MKIMPDPQTILANTATAPSPSPEHQRDARKLKESCQEFEAILIQSMFKAMRKAVPEGGLFEKNNSTKIFEDMLDGEIAKEISKKQSLGLADQMYRQMEKHLKP